MDFKAHETGLGSSNIFDENGNFIPVSDRNPQAAQAQQSLGIAHDGNTNGRNRESLVANETTKPVAEPASSTHVSQSDQIRDKILANTGLLPDQVEFSHGDKGLVLLKAGAIVRQQDLESAEAPPTQAPEITSSGFKQLGRFALSALDRSSKIMSQSGHTRPVASLAARHKQAKQVEIAVPHLAHPITRLGRDMVDRLAVPEFNKSRRKLAAPTIARLAISEKIKRLSIFFSAEMPSFNGIKRVLSNVKGWPPAATDRLERAQAAVINNLTNPEFKTERRVAAILLGGLAVVTAYATTKGFELSSHVPPHELAQHALHANVNHQVEPMRAPVNHIKDILKVPKPFNLDTTHRPATIMATHTSRAAAKLKQHVETLNYYGDTVWYHVQAQVQAKFGHHLSPERLTILTDHFTKLTEKIDGIKNNGRDMFKGQHFRLPLITNWK